MAKAPPSFQFYPSDFITGTATLTAEETGAYIRLLCHQWVSAKPLPSNMKKLAALSGIAPDAFVEVWHEIAPKFKQCRDGYLNERLEQVRKDSAAYRERQRKNAMKRWGDDSNIVEFKKGALDDI